MLEAYLPLSCPSILCLSLACVLRRLQIHVTSNSPGQLREAGSQLGDRLYVGICAFRVLGPNGSALAPLVSLLKRPVPRILGTQCLGHVLVY